ncbi:MAG TPA: hypothetical protein VGN16_01340 [Acidobacteriaceae bacterium]|jgi:hypothetical protein
MLNNRIREILDVLVGLRELVVTASFERLDSYGKVHKVVDTVTELNSSSIPKGMKARMERFCEKWDTLSKKVSADIQLSEEDVKEAIGDLVDLYGDCVTHARRWQKED